MLYCDPGLQPLTHTELQEYCTCTDETLPAHIVKREEGGGVNSKKGGSGKGRMHRGLWNYEEVHLMICNYDILLQVTDRTIKSNVFQVRT